MTRFRHEAQPATVPVTADGLRRLQLALEAQIAAAGASGVLTFNNRSGAVSLLASDVNTALGFSFAGKAGQTVRVNASENALELAATELANVIHTQSTPATEWIVNHNKGNYPAIAVLSPGSLVVDAEIEHTSVNQTRVRFAAAQTGSVVAR